MASCESSSKCSSCLLTCVGASLGMGTVLAKRGTRYQQARSAPLRCCRPYTELWQGALLGATSVTRPQATRATTSWFHRSVCNFGCTASCTRARADMRGATPARGSYLPISCRKDKQTHVPRTTSARTAAMPEVPLHSPVLWDRWCLHCLCTGLRWKRGVSLAHLLAEGGHPGKVPRSSAGPSLPPSQGPGKQARQHSPDSWISRLCCCPSFAEASLKVG